MNLTDNKEVLEERRKKKATEAYKLWKEGYSLSKIGNIMGFSRQRIHQFIQEFSENELNGIVDNPDNKPI